MSDMIKALTKTVRGRVIVASDPDYDEARPSTTPSVKAAYDPDNLFHVNQNIAPAKRR
jgi:Berberine and berberine like